MMFAHLGDLEARIVGAVGVGADQGGGAHLKAFCLILSTSNRSYHCMVTEDVASCVAHVMQA
jgi:hypothetical protein